jgi:hypothetical protein
LDWIVQEVFNLPPLLEGHQQAVQRVTTPGLSWLRLITLAVARQNRLGLDLKAMALVEISKSSDIPIPNAATRVDDRGLAQQVGVLLGRVFGEGDECTVDGYLVRRIKERDRATGEEMKYYRFEKLGGRAEPEM